MLVRFGWWLILGSVAVLVDDDFIRCLFDIIEDLSYDVTDPYHYPVIRVLVSVFLYVCVGFDADALCSWF
jgi:hypothetical protein